MKENPIESELRETIGPMPGLEDIYDIASDGQIRLVKYPKSKSDLVRLILFFTPKPLNLQEIRQATGIEKPKSFMKGDHFMNLPNETYALSAEGRTYISSKIIPELQKNEGEE